MRRAALIILAAISITACGGRKAGLASQADAPDPAAAQQTGKKTSFPMPSIPEAITAPEARASYLVKHFWDNFDFADTAYIKIPDVTEQGFADFLNMLRFVPPHEADTALERMMQGASRDKLMLDHFLELSERYLYDPMSPMRDDEYYIPVLRYAVNSDKLDEVEKIRPKTHLEMVLQNRRGHRANDIAYTKADGSRGNLYNIKSPYTLLFVNNPDCTACAMIIEDLKASEVVNDMLSSGTLTILAVYPDKDLEAWRKHRVDIPGNWIYSYDAGQTMTSKRTYDLKAIPTLYLLDGEKNVLIKDAAEVFPIERYLMAHY